MSEHAPSGPLTPEMPEHKAPESGWLRFVAPQPDTVSVRAATHLLRRIGGECGAWAVVLVVALVLLAPVAACVVAGGWAIYTYVHGFVTLWQNVSSYQLSNLVQPLDSLSLAAQVALASAGYFALLAALIVLMAGLLGKRWGRLFLFPGITFTLPSALAFFIGFRLSLDALAAPSGIPLPVRTALLVYLLLDAIVLAAVLVDVSPRRRRTHRARWMPGRQRTPSAPLAPVHFGSSGPLATRREAAEAPRKESLVGAVGNMASEVAAGPAAVAASVEQVARASVAPETPTVESQREGEEQSGAIASGPAPELLSLVPTSADEKTGADVDTPDDVPSALAPAS
ncbi:MAG TPA: hypothetical protein VKT52_12445 [Ktedonobacterales bacterium]|nr:hypothetical protein [Ktedonobacterales bacterium]